MKNQSRGKEKETVTDETSTSQENVIGPEKERETKIVIDTEIEIKMIENGIEIGKGTGLETGSIEDDQGRLIF